MEKQKINQLKSDFFTLKEFIKSSTAARLKIDNTPNAEVLRNLQYGVQMVLDVIRAIKEKEPRVHITGAVSNVSFNLPIRKVLNQSFLVLAMQAGMDSAVMNPCNRDLMGILYATQAMLGEDMFCISYIGAYREGKFGPVKNETKA